LYNNSGVPYGVQLAQHPQQMVTQKSAVSVKVAVVSTARHHHGNLCPIPAHAHIGDIGAIMPETLGKYLDESTPPSPTTGAGAHNTNVRQSPETDAARRRARQSIREHELIWLLQQRLRAVSWPHWRFAANSPECSFPILPIVGYPRSQLTHWLILRGDARRRGGRANHHVGGLVLYLLRRPRHGSCQTLITLTRRSLSVSRALRVLSSCVLTSVLGAACC